MDAILAEKPRNLGRLVNELVDPIVERARTRKGKPVNRNQTQRNRNTLQKVRELYAAVKNQSVRNSQAAWMNRFGDVLEAEAGAAPAAVVVPGAVVPVGAASPWIEKQSRASGKTYWYNPDTKESVWKNPMVAAAPAPVAKLTPLAPLPLPVAAPVAAAPVAAPAAAPKPVAAPVAAAPKPVAAPAAAAPKPVAAPVAAAPKPASTVAPAASSPGRFPTLYSVSKVGKTQVWSIRVKRGEFEASTIIVTYGYEGGKMQVNEKVIERGKAGRTAHQQAILEATADWKKKKDSGYAEVVGNAQVPRAAQNEQVTGQVKALLPMLAHDYHKQGKKIVFPAYVQAKLDGVRSIYNNGVMTTRMGKPFTGLEHILAELGPAKEAGLVLDGEVYSDTLSFQQFVGLVRKKSFTEADRVQLQNVKLWVYDCVAAGPFSERLARLKAFFAENKFAHVQLLPTEEAASAAELKAFHDKYVAAGYEGLIVRNKAGPYELATRSYHLQKYKEFEDSEFEVVGAEEGEGQEKGLVIWVCKTDGGRQFRVRPRGTHEERAELWRRRAEYIGKKLTVRYQELTADGIPRFPVGLAFRDYE